MTKRIFINYRRDDTEGDSGRLHDRVARHAGKRNVFWDRDDLAPGEDFVDRIAQTAADVDIVLAVIGPSWASPENLARLHDEGDWVRRELEAGVRSASTRIVPVLVRGAEWPPAGDLPASLQPMTARQAWEIRADQFNRDVSIMLRRLRVPNWRIRAGLIAVALGVAIGLGSWAVSSNGDPVAGPPNSTTTQAPPTTPGTTTLPTTTVPPTTLPPTTLPTTTEPPATALQTTTSSTTAAPTTTEDPGCGVSSQSLPPQAVNVDSGNGDFDGDGRSDRLFAYNVELSPEISRFFVQLANGYTHEFVDVLYTQQLSPQVMGALDINSDGTEEAFVRYGGGASTDTVRVLTFVDCRLATLGEFLVGGSVGYGEGLSCPFDDVDLVDYAASATVAGDGYLVSWRGYRIVEDTLELVEEETGIEVSFQDDLVDAAYQLNCGDLSTEG